ncbi:MAG: carboxynorspermidine decarboxylase [Bacteroidaceae bacterium]
MTPTTPYYLLEEPLLRRNLRLISHVARESGAEIILAFKAFALWRTFPIFRQYITHTTASSPYEARLALEEFGSPAHTYSPAYTERDFPEIMRCSSHITFNSLSQYERFWPLAAAYEGHPISCGLRVNPEYSEIATDLYNPCAPGSRFGVLATDMPHVLPPGIKGFHCHCLCESSSETLERVWHHLEQKFGRWLPRLEWLNLGGGHLMTRKDYNADHLIQILKHIQAKHPNLKLILEPGSAFAWQTGPLVASVVDIVCNRGIRTAILDVSFTCHMPDCLEMPYQPAVRNALSIGAEEADEATRTGAGVYRLGGNSCLSGDYMGYWQFDHELQIGEKVIFEDMIHYTTVKTTMFNGIHHPSIVMRKNDGTLQILRQYGYSDYRDRMD